MPGRPPSSAGSSQFYSATGERPTTSAGAFDAARQYAYPADYSVEEEEEEESDDENVFAFLPPSTADQRQQSQLELQHMQNRDQYPPKLAPVNSIPDTPPLEFPPRTFDPQARYPADSLSSPAGPPTPTHPYLPPDSPPSTSSHNTDGLYPMHRMASAPSIPSAHQHVITTANSTATTASREVHVALPSRKEKDPESVPHRRPKRNPSSITESSSMSPSIIGEQSREGSIKMEFDFDGIEEEDSPYAEVRASVSNIDDPDMPALTIRMWAVGLILCMASSAMNVFFNFRSPAPSVVPLVLLLVSYPCGKFLAFALPITIYHLPLPRLPQFCARVPFLRSAVTPRSIEFCLNPGPWNIKEHVLVFMMANVAVGSPYALNAVVVSEIYYQIKLDYWFNLVLVLATQLTGFGLAGVCRRFLVWPASMVWPQNLVACTLLNTLHAEDDEGAGGITRFRFYMFVTVGSFVYFFLPGFLFQALSIFSFVCWIVPNNIPVNQLFGVHSGLGMSVLTFDWTQISWIGSPLMVPWWAQVHIFGGFVLFYWILTPALYYSNAWKLSYFPLSANGPYDRFGNAYNITRVLLQDDTFNITAYDEYSPLYLPATYAVTYLLAFALSTCVLVHTFLYHGQSLLNGIKKIKVEQDDIHAKLMRNYPEVPDWWYFSVFVTFFGLAIVAVEVWHTSVPVWALVLAVLLPIIYVLPSCFIYAMTGQGITINLLAQVIPGTLLPGNPLANMVFKAYSAQTLAEAVQFTQSLKLGHYVKVPPRASFMAQAVATTLAAFIQVGMKQWMFGHIKDICQPNQKSSLTCPHNQVFFTASAIWGLIGPSRQFGSGSIYHPNLYAILIGAFLPIPFWLWQRRYPGSWVKLIITPVILNGVASIPPATGINYSSWFAIGFVFQYLIRKRNFAWWSKFNYVTSAALDSGTVISLIVIFFTLEFPKHGSLNVNWWGNTIFTQNADWNRPPLRQIPNDGIPL